MKKRIVRKLVMILAVCFLLIGCGTTYNENNENIQFVKEGTLGSYTTTCGKAFDDFFDNPKWGYFNSESGEDVVEFTGKCLYDNVEVEVLMQFTLNKAAGTFSVNYLSFNDVTQNKLMVTALLEAVFEQ